MSGKHTGERQDLTRSSDVQCVRASVAWRREAVSTARLGLPLIVGQVPLQAIQFSQQLTSFATGR